jgi:membrane-associated phospholipid phosphatase
MKTAGRRLVAGLEVRAADAVILGGMGLLLLLTAVFHARLDRPAALIGRNLFYVALYAGTLVALPRLRSRPLRFLLRTAPVQFMYLQIFLTSRDLQLLFFSWNDDTVLAWEQAVFGSQPLVWVQKLYSPLLTEWMFFVYVAYIVIYPILAAVIFFRRGEAANEDYLFQLGLINLVCGLGFILYPVAGPLRWEKARALLTEPIPSGGVFGAMAEYIRAHVHAPGGTIPSPHCAVATVMWFMSWKYTRWGFFLLAPVILSLYVSTVYGRFHYLSDSVIGIAAAVPVLLAAPALEKAWNRRFGERPEAVR